MGKTDAMKWLREKLDRALQSLSAAWRKFKNNEPPTIQKPYAQKRSSITPKAPLKK